MKQLNAILNSLPQDVALQIASLLEVQDVCALGCCSRFWRELCDSECIWEALFIERWPSLASAVDLPASSSSSYASPDAPNLKEWRKVYIKKHNEVAEKVAAVVKYVEESSYLTSLEVGQHLNAIENLCAMKLSFADVKMFLFKSKLNVLINLVGLHYSLSWLRVQVDTLKEALESKNIGGRNVCVTWWRLGRWFYGFRMRDEWHSCASTLMKLLLDEDEELVLGVLQRGAVHEVLRIQISANDHRTSSSTSWSSSYNQPSQG